MTRPATDVSVNTQCQTGGECEPQFFALLEIFLGHLAATDDGLDDSAHRVAYEDAVDLQSPPRRLPPRCIPRPGAVAAGCRKGAAASGVQKCV